MTRTDAFGDRGFHAADDLAQLVRVFVLDVFRKNTLVGAVVDDHEVGPLVLELDSPLDLVEIPDHHLNLSAIQS